MTVLRLLLPPGAWRTLLPFTALALWRGLPEAATGLSGHLLNFAICGLGLLPLAVALSHLVEQLVDRLGARLGGLVSAMLGNLVEFLVAFNALTSGLYPLVVMSIAGSVVINCLAVLGIGTMIACRGRQTVAVNPVNQELANQQLMISAILLAVPSIFYNRPLNEALQGNNSADSFSLYSELVAVLALLVYGLALAFGSTETSQHRAEDAGTEPPIKGGGSLAPLLTALSGLTILVAIVSDRLVDALQQMVDGSHLSPLFVGLFLLPLFGCLPEALVAWRAARRRQISLVMTSTVESSLQLLLFVLPLLVLCGLPLNRHLHLGLPPVALAALGVAVVMIERITANHRLNSYEGLQLLVLFLVLALGSLLLISPSSVAPAVAL